jgi:hypothetical protein
LLSQWPDVAEGDIWLVGGGLRMKFVEKRCHTGTLNLGVSENGRTSANVSILFFDLRRSPTCDDRSEKTLERERNEVPIGKKILEEVVSLGYLRESIRRMNQDVWDKRAVAGPPMFIMTIAVPADNNSAEQQDT